MGRPKTSAVEKRAKAAERKRKQRGKGKWIDAVVERPYADCLRAMAAHRGVSIEQALCALLDRAAGVPKLKYMMVEEPSDRLEFPLDDKHFKMLRSGHLPWGDAIENLVLNWTTRKKINVWTEDAEEWPQVNLWGPFWRSEIRWVFTFDGFERLFEKLNSEQDRCQGLNLSNEHDKRQARVQRSRDWQETNGLRREVHDPYTAMVDARINAAIEAKNNYVPQSQKPDADGYVRPRMSLDGEIYREPRSED